MTAPENILKTLAADYLAAKQAETAAIATRRELGDNLAKIMKDRDEGTRTETIDGLKLSITYKLTRKVDTNALTNTWEILPENVRKAFKWEADLNTKHFRALEEAAPEDYRKAVEFVTTKEAAPSITVEIQ